MERFFRIGQNYGNLRKDIGSIIKNDENETVIMKLMRFLVVIISVAILVAHTFVI